MDRRAWCATVHGVTKESDITKQLTYLSKGRKEHIAVPIFLIVLGRKKFSYTLRDYFGGLVIKLTARHTNQGKTNLITYA